MSTEEHSPKVTNEGRATFIRWGNYRQYLVGEIDGLPLSQLRALEEKLEGTGPIPREDLEAEIDAWIDAGPDSWDPIYWDWEVSE